VLDPILGCIEVNDLCKERLSKYLTATGEDIPQKRNRTANCEIASRGEMAPMSVSE